MSIWLHMQGTKALCLLSVVKAVAQLRPLSLKLEDVHIYVWMDRYNFICRIL